MWVILWLILTLVNQTGAQLGAFFVSRNKVHTLHDSWFLTLTIDLQPYKTYLGQLRRELDQLKEMVLFVQYQGKDLDKDEEIYHKRVYNLVSTELDKFKESFYSLGDIVQEVELALEVRKG